ncbi:zinc finger C4H2 domain-containing protein-like [Mercenaria mercenaria]|uniref:zinc finger C4H2 domain-containing protein-like n=1 Tax=Mercenaria mercenaria TaxID=6596 RepID=UPI001E1DE6C1|nr:zinc finger C4H2 domain-containing protein-like [Mercenaria mercenaria]
MGDERDVEILHKLDGLKEIRSKTINLERIKTKLRQEFDTTENEDKLIAEYKKEMELLLQEKMAHVEELRLIHADINLMETTIKQAEEERNRSLENAKHLYDDYKPLKEEVDSMRTRVGLEPLLGLNDEEEKISPQYFDRPKSEYHTEQPGTSDPQPQIQPQIVAPPVVPPPLPVQMNRAKPTTEQPRQAFRQQPPPMKACLSCHQQIHRNAPICPLCKAKSRSRNPKKPKRKLDE